MNLAEVALQGEGRRLDAYLVAPEGARRRPALIVVHEIWGLDDHIRDVARRFAGAGYVVLAPDLYTGPWRQAMQPDRIMAGMQFLRQAPPEVQRDPSRLEPVLAEMSAEEAAAMRTLMRVMTAEQRQAFARDLRHAVRFLQEQPNVDPAGVHCLGFCMGGGITAQLAAIEPSLRGAVVFYGENPPLDKVPAIEAKVLGLYGADDARITDTVPALAEAMARADKPFSYHVYPGAPHAFFNDTRPTYRPEAARDAMERVLDFLR